MVDEDALLREDVERLTDDIDKLETNLSVMEDERDAANDKVKALFGIIEDAKDELDNALQL